MQAFTLFSEKLATLQDLVKTLPKTVPIAKKSDRIHQIFTSIPHPENGDEHHEAFNRRMDALFGEDTRDNASGRLLNVKRGPFGMDAMMKYLVQATEAGFLLWDIHPSMRASWFSRLGATPISKTAAIDSVKILFKHVAETYFEDSSAVSVSASQAAPEAQASQHDDDVTETDWLDDVCAIEASSLPVPAPSISRTSREMFDDELDRYLEKFEGGPGQRTSPLAWWKIHAPAFPTIARMARDFLAIPGTSVTVERTFSKSRHICTDLRSSLKADTIAQSLLTKVWIQSGLLDVQEPVKRKRKHGEVPE